MKLTNIQWCHSTINPAPGCDSCELWPSAGVIKKAILKALALVISAESVPPIQTAAPKAVKIKKTKGEPNEQ